jgi:uncharacterized protein YfbU (UPF0304 family)
MSDFERQSLINQYELLSQSANKIPHQKKYYDLQIEYLQKGQIYLFEYALETKSPYFENLITKKDSSLLIDILKLHDIINTSAKTHNTKTEILQFDFNNDSPYYGFIEDAINSKLFHAYSNFKVINSHGVKRIKDHIKQVKFWKKIGKPNILNVNDLNQILNYYNLP